jgi:hypothetical protein
VPNKLGRNYVLSIQSQFSSDQNSTVEIHPPFTVEFDVFRNDFSAANISKIRIHNLSATTRAKIRKDQFDSNSKQIILKAGYGNNLTEILNANIWQAFSVREGTEYVTEIDAYDAGGAYTNAKTNISFPAGTPQQSVIRTLMSSFSAYGVTLGAIGAFPGTIGRGNTYSGSTCNILDQITNGNWFIDNGRASALGNTEALFGTLNNIDSSMGLLGTPIRENQIFNFDMVFEPRIVIGQGITLTSSTGSGFNGTHKVVGIHHKGMISESVSGTAITSIRCTDGAYNFVPLVVS